MTRFPVMILFSKMARFRTLFLSLRMARFRLPVPINKYGSLLDYGALKRNGCLSVHITIPSISARSCEQMPIF